MRRWIWRISIGLTILIVLLIVTVQIVLWSPLPKRIVIQQIEKELGLRISADSLTTGWLGKSQLQNVSLGLPLAPGDFLKVKTLTIQHTSLIGLALGRAVSVDSIEIDEPEVDVMQDAQGQWNLAQVAELLAKAGGANTAQESTANHGVPKLPAIKLVNGTVHVSDNQKHTLALEPLNISGYPNGTLVWKYDATISDAVTVQGVVAPGGRWLHQVTLGVRNLDPLLKGWGIKTSFHSVVSATWNGQFGDGKVSGNLAINEASAKELPSLGNVTVTGSVDLQTAGNVITAHPNNLNLKTSSVTLPNIGLVAGAIVSDNTGVQAQGLKVSALGGLANLDGKFDPKSQAVDLQVNWSGLSLAKKTNQSGSLTASLRQPFAGQPVIKVDLVSNGTFGDTTPEALTPPNRFNAKLDLTGQGTSWKTIDWVLVAPQLTYSTATQVYDLSQTSAHVSQNLPAVDFDLALPATVGSRLNGINFTSNGNYNTNTGIWKLDAGGGFNTAYQQSPIPVTISLHADGDREKANLKNFTVAASDITVSAEGSYDKKKKPLEPVDLHVNLTQQKRILPDAAIQGEVSGKFDIVGILFSEQGRIRPYLTTTGDLRSSDLVLFNRPIGDVDIKLTGTTATPKIPTTTPSVNPSTSPSESVDEQIGPVCTQIKTTDFYLFQAPWTFIANYPNNDGMLEMSLEARNLPLEELAKFAKVSGLSGQITSAKWTAKLPSLNPNEIDLQSEYHLVHLAEGSLKADSVDAVATLQKGVFRLNPLHAKNGDGTLNTTASIDLKNPRHVLTETTLEKWPYAASDAVMAVVSAHNTLDVDLRPGEFGASGGLTSTSDLLIGATKTKLAHCSFDATINKRLVQIDKLAGNILSGTFNGSGTIDFDRPLQAVAQIFWQDVDAATLATLFPATDGIGGKTSGTITIVPARDPRPLAPIRMDVNAAFDGGHFRSLKIGGPGLLALHAVAYLDTTRAVLAHSDIYLGGGVVHVWGRVDQRKETGLTAQTSIDFAHLDLDQLAHVYPKLEKPTPGQLDGHILVLRSGTRLDQVTASAHIDLTRTDLINVGPLTTLYNIMNAGGGVSSEPNGYGKADLAFEQNVVHITGFRFFNRGIDAHGLVNVGPIDFDDIGQTPIGGQVVGAVRTLKGTKIPLLADFDTYFTAFAGSLTTVNLFGSVEKPGYNQAGFAEIGGAMRELLVGDERADQGQ